MAHGNAFAWTAEIEDEIFGRMLSGDGIVQILGDKRDDFLPTERTFYRRLQEDDAFRQRYVRAREIQAHREADEVKEIADAAKPEGVGVARLQMDARRWRAGKLAPKVYGDKVAIGGADDLPAIRSQLDPTKLSPAAMRELLAAYNANAEPDAG